MFEYVEPTVGPANHFVIERKLNELGEKRKDYQVDFNRESFNTIKTNSGKKLSLSDCTNLFSIIHAINLKQAERNKNPFARFWSWLTNNTKAEDKLRTDAINFATKLLGGDVSKFAHQTPANMGNLIETAADRNILSKTDPASKKILGVDDKTKSIFNQFDKSVHSLTQEEMDKARIDGIKYEADLQRKTEEGQKRNDEIFRHNLSDEGLGLDDKGVDLTETQKLQNQLDKDLGNDLGKNNLTKEEYDQLGEYMKKINEEIDLEDQEKEVGGK